MANYKVILRQSLDQGDSLWEPGCPLIVETLQVSRNTETGEAYLQVKIKNVSAYTIASFHASFTVSFEQQEDQVIEVKKLDADLNPGYNLTLPPTPLLDGAVQAVHYAIDQAKGEAVDWQSQMEVQPLPSAQLQPLDAVARQERIRSLQEAHIRKAEAIDRAIVNGDGWWRCACGGVTVGAPRCSSCFNEQPYLSELEQEEFLHNKAEQREATQKEAARQAAEAQALAKKRSKKALKIAISVIAVLILAVLLWILVINPMLQNNKIQSLSNDGRHEEAIELLLDQDNTLDRQVEVIDAAAEAGNLTRVYNVYKILDPSNPNVSYIVGLMKDYVENHPSTDDPTTRNYLTVLEDELSSSEFANMLGIEYEFSLTSWAQYANHNKEWRTDPTLNNGNDLPILLFRAVSSPDSDIDYQPEIQLEIQWYLRDADSKLWLPTESEPEIFTVKTNGSLYESTTLFDSDSWLSMRYFPDVVREILESGEFQVTVKDATSKEVLFEGAISH